MWKTMVLYILLFSSKICNKMRHNLSHFFLRLLTHMYNFHLIFSIIYVPDGTWFECRPRPLACSMTTRRHTHKSWQRYGHRLLTYVLPPTLNMFHSYFLHTNLCQKRFPAEKKRGKNPIFISNRSPVCLHIKM